MISTVFGDSRSGLCREPAYYLQGEITDMFRPIVHIRLRNYLARFFIDLYAFGAERAAGFVELFSGEMGELVG
jgi:hypothetical protein